MPIPDLGIMVEGVVELDPMTGRLVIRYEAKDGSFQFLDVQERLLAYKGEDVRCIITPMAGVAELARMVESGAINPEDMPTVPKLN